MQGACTSPSLDAAEAPNPHLSPKDGSARSLIASPEGSACSAQQTSAQSPHTLPQAPTHGPTARWYACAAWEAGSEVSPAESPICHATSAQAGFSAGAEAAEHQPCHSLLPAGLQRPVRMFANPVWEALSSCSSPSSGSGQQGPELEHEQAALQASKIDAAPSWLPIRIQNTSVRQLASFKHLMAPVISSRTIPRAASSGSDSSLLAHYKQAGAARKLHAAWEPSRVAEQGSSSAGTLSSQHRPDPAWVASVLAATSRPAGQGFAMSSNPLFDQQAPVQKLPKVPPAAMQNLLRWL